MHSHRRSGHSIEAHHIPTTRYLTKDVSESNEPATSQPPDHSERHQTATRSPNITQIFRRLCALFDGDGGYRGLSESATISRYESCCNPSRAVIVLVRISYGD